EGFVCSVIGRLSRRYPRVTFRVHATDTATAYQALLSRKVDLAIVHAIDVPNRNLMEVEVLLQDPHVVVAGRTIQSFGVARSAWTRSWMNRGCCRFPTSRMAQWSPRHFARTDCRFHPLSSVRLCPCERPCSRRAASYRSFRGLSCNFRRRAGC